MKRSAIISLAATGLTTAQIYTIQTETSLTSTPIPPLHPTPSLSIYPITLTSIPSFSGTITNHLPYNSTSGGAGYFNSTTTAIGGGGVGSNSTVVVINTSTATGASASSSSAATPSSASASSSAAGGSASATATPSTTTGGSSKLALGGGAIGLGLVAGVVACL